MPTCPSCGTNAQTEAWRYHEYRIMACPRCDLQFVDSMQGAPVEYYHSHYIPLITQVKANTLHPSVKPIVTTIVRAAAQYLPAQRRHVIDVGCGPGYILAALRAEGFEGYGIDFNPDVVQVAHEHFGLVAEVQRIEDVLSLDTRYDLALLIHVLEHVEQPAALLRDVRRLLDPGGILIIDVPNRNRFSLRRSLQRGDLGEGEYPPHHLTFWSKRALSNALLTAGYQVLECDARTPGDHGQIAAFLSYRLKLPQGKATSLLNDAISRAFALAKVQGDALYAIACTL